MSGFDQNKVVYNTGTGNDFSLESDGGVGRQEKITEKLQKRIFSFLNSFKRDKEIYYRVNLLKNYSLGNYYLQISLEDLASYDETLYNYLTNDPVHYMALFEESAREVVAANFSNQIELELIVPIQILIMGDLEPILLRKLTADLVSKLTCISGIIISSSRIQAKPMKHVLFCASCGDEITIFMNSDFSNSDIPKRCLKNPQGTCNSYTLLPERTVYVDQQIMKIQETPESIPTGELPRHAQLVVDRSLVGRIVPGMRVVVMGVLSLYSNKADGVDNASIRMSYIKAFGIEVNTGGLGRANKNFTEQEVQEFKLISKDPNVYEKIVKKIAPVVYGHEDIKCALACQLFGGCSKQLPDSTRLRGDINILLLGDPGTAKSQMLKFIESMAPVGVYTSGKGSSAAGLTASVIRDPQNREFYLEGGAMVLADGGIVCIDEFDKMRKQDRVAIHEAMEQQTISIAKAGITTILNARTAVFAAANPSFGAYDETHTVSENFNEFRSTILSRFDAIFLIKDTKDQERDAFISKHVLDTHLNYRHSKHKNTAPSIFNDEFYKLKRYILYCRQNCFPKLAEGAAKELVDHYVLMRKQYKDRERSGEGNVIPITVRQLEAIIRFSEALAKMSLSPFATESHVSEAIRIFTVSSIEATNSGKVVMEVLSDATRAEVENVEVLIKKRLSIDSSMRLKSLIFQLSKNVCVNVFDSHILTLISLNFLK